MTGGDELAALDATARAAMVRNRETSARELANAAISSAERRNPALNAIIHPSYERALAVADAVAASVADGPLAGVPIVLKDAAVTQAGEPFHEGLQPARDAGYRATTTSWLVERLRAAGCVVIGRTNVPELCTHVTTEPLAYGPTRNPWSLAHSAGGSSGGSAAAVAAGIVPIAHGSDGGGSIRAPGSFCGLVGLKPTRGRLTTGPDAGEHWAGLSTDGYLTTSVRDAALVFDAVAGPADGDPHRTPVTYRLVDVLHEPLPQLRIGLRTHGACGGDPAHPEVDQIVRSVAALLAAEGHLVEEASPGGLDEEAAMAHQRSVVGVCVAAEVDRWSRRLGRPIGLDELEPRNRATVAGAREVNGPTYVESLTWLQLWARRLAAWFVDHDLLVTPVVTHPPPRIGELPIEPTAEQAVQMRKRLGWLLGAWNVTGQPAITVPGGFSSDGLPVGVQLVAAWGREDLLVRAARLIEVARPWPRVASTPAAP
jgi:amidase